MLNLNYEYDCVMIGGNLTWHTFRLMVHMHVAYVER